MRHAILYTLNTQEILCEDAKIVLAKMDNIPDFRNFTVIGDDAIATNRVTRIEIPIHHLRRYNGSAQHHPFVPPSDDLFVAIHPDVEEILMVPIREKYSAVVSENENLRYKQELDGLHIRKLEHQLKCYQDWDARLSALKWWQRVWMLITGDYRC